MIGKTNEAPILCTIDLSDVQQVVTDNILQELQVPEDDTFLLNTYRMELKIADMNQTQNIEIPKEARNAINYEQAIKEMNQNKQEALISES